MFTVFDGDHADDDDPLRPARGIVHSLVISLAMWGAFVLVWVVL